VDETIPVTIGVNTYRTKEYNGLTWMVENSMEGTSSAQMYDSNPMRLRGYYYTNAQATNSSTGPCTGIWRLPTESDVRSLYEYFTREQLSMADKWYWQTPIGWSGGRNATGLWQNWGVQNRLQVQLELCAIWHEGYIPLTEYTSAAYISAVRCVHD
jgi:uncharacterized protein (TIGR02145 family)